MYSFQVSKHSDKHINSADISFYHLLTFSTEFKHFLFSQEFNPKTKKQKKINANDVISILQKAAYKSNLKTFPFLHPSLSYLEGQPFWRLHLYQHIVRESVDGSHLSLFKI